MVPTTTTTIYFNEVVFPSVLGLTSPMDFPTIFTSTLTCPKHLPYKVPSFSYLLSMLSQEGGCEHTILKRIQTGWLKFNTSLHLFLGLPFTPSPSICSVSILFIQHNSSLLSTWPNHLNLFLLHHFSNIINCQHAPHPLITFPFT